MSDNTIYKSIDALNPVVLLVDEANKAMAEPSRIASDNKEINAALGAVAGVGVGGGVGYAALFFLGVEGLAAPGIVSALAAAGGLVGGGMVAGIAVIAAPAVILGVVGYALVANRNEKKLKEKKEMLLQEVLRNHNGIIKELLKTSDENKSRIDYLTKLNILLQAAYDGLCSDLGVIVA